MRRGSGLYLAAMRSPKIRGLRRHFRRFQRLQQQLSEVEFDTLQQREFFQIFPLLDPWGWGYYDKLARPPAGFRREVLRGLLAVHAQWQRELAAYPEPYQLALELFEQSFPDSRVIVRIRGCIWTDAERAATPVPGNPPLPAEYQSVPGIEQLCWTACYQEQETSAEDYPDDAEGRAALQAMLRRFGYREAVDAAGRPVYYLRISRVWVGTAPT